MTLVTSVEQYLNKLTTCLQYQILRQKGTERPGTGEYNKFKPAEGYFACRGCGAKLYEYVLLS